MIHAGAMLVAMGADAAWGWPDRIHARIGHPVTWIGRLIAALDRRWNRGTPEQRRSAGLACAVVVVLAAALPAALLQSMLPGGPVGAVLTGLLAWPLVAMRSMHEHVAAVEAPLAAGDLPAARRAVSMIVGRDPSQLDTAGVTRAALESLAENSSDGIVAPLFWGALFGLPGIAAYKAINTLDSMIGHRTPRHEDFGRASALTDDVVNLIPARLTGGLFALVSGRPREALSVMRRDARAHRSPNAGWPEAALAGALGVRLSGPRVYGDRVSAEPWLNAGAPDPSPADLRQGLGLYRRAMALLAAGLALIMLI
ncbi:adenosylcobinamide-phosphate synthase CbiB [Cereibacter sphaeroides]|uniref:adenosylcobinamide-phosphate synthase CbiB n=1 Tax=Cereibacter sphaeroides TaxID=1063 RepID=UPI001F17DD37|nr:adenosylcobinamide-phosphate synthase CbiB [Cereibacter sphaeroides]MCE6957837.1 adenosylcobinamide-phosphate synthase CbiB [Cereibacter sphaeroides]MCE6972701.1 adenosylcobinamide-phosphate synthase CbiB [Cereibacter sphaeroides]